MSFHGWCTSGSGKPRGSEILGHLWNFGARHLADGTSCQAPHTYRMPWTSCLILHTTYNYKCAQVIGYWETLKLCNTYLDSMFSTKGLRMKECSINKCSLWVTKPWRIMAIGYIFKHKLCMCFSYMTCDHFLFI
jgi:hypothetical protein